MTKDSPMYFSIPPDFIGFLLRYESDNEDVVSLYIYIYISICVQAHTTIELLSVCRGICIGN